MVEVFDNRADYIEKIGTGISRIRNAVREHGKSSVEFVFTEFFTVRFSRGKLSVEDSTGKGDLKVDGTLNGGLNGTLNGTLNLLFEFINENPGVQASFISEKLERPLDTIKKQIKKLVDNDLVERRGSKKTGGYWVK